MLRNKQVLAQIQDEENAPRPDFYVSPKIQQLALDLKAQRKNGKVKALVFTQWTESLDLLEHALRPTFSMVRLDGSMSSKEREETVARFQGGSVEVFLISLLAGGLGLNLTAANSVYIMEPWWNHAVEGYLVLFSSPAQAIDRACRIGQQQAVSVTRYIARDSIEEEILKLQRRKADVAGRSLSGQHTSMNEADFIRALRDFFLA